jgi:predicted nucleic acid-binding protein
MRLRRPELVVDASALAAALDPDDPAHLAVRTELGQLLEQVRAGQVVLVSHSDAVLTTAALLTARGLPASVHDRLWALTGAFQLEVLHPDVLADADAVRRAAADRGLSVEPAQAITIELARRRGTDQVLATDPTYLAVGLTIRPDGAATTVGARAHLRSAS